MLLSKNYKIGKTFEELEVGLSLKITENIEDKDLLLYLGLTNDSNPLYIQHEYAAMTEFEKPVVPTTMLVGIVTSAISKFMPGPGSYVSNINLSYPQPLYHYETMHLMFKVVKKNSQTKTVEIEVEAKNNADEIVLVGAVIVTPPTAK